jgi:hypothetical protein
VSNVLGHLCEETTRQNPFQNDGKRQARQRYHWLCDVSTTFRLN